MTLLTNELLYDLEKMLHLYEVRSKKSELIKFLSPTFFEFGSSGKKLTLENVLEILVKEDGSTVIESFNYESKQLSDNVYLIAYISRHVSKDHSEEFIRSSIWRNNSGIWQMEFHQGTKSK